MKIFPAGIEFAYKRGKSKSLEKIDQGFTDQTACNLLRTAVFYAQQDGDHKFDSLTGEKEDIKRQSWNRSCPRALAALAVANSDLTKLPLATRLALSESEGGVKILTCEVQTLTEMLDWLPGRTLRFQHDPNIPKYGRLLQEMHPLVLSALRKPLPTEDTVRIDFEQRQTAPRELCAA